MSSDFHRASVCLSCGSILGPTPSADPVTGRISVQCHVCGPEKQSFIREIGLPYVTRYLANELAAMGIRMSLDIKSCQ